MNLGLGEKLLHVENQLYRDICNIFQQSGIDASLGVLILESVQSKLLKLGTEALLQRAVNPDPIEEPKEEAGQTERS